MVKTFENVIFVIKQEIIEWNSEKTDEEINESKLLISVIPKG